MYQQNMIYRRRILKVHNRTTRGRFHRVIFNELLCITASYAIDRTVNYHLLFERSMSVLLSLFCSIAQIDGPFK